MAISIAIAKAQLYAAVQQERRQLRAILDQTPAAIVVADAEGYPIIANPLAKQIFDQVGTVFEQLRGRPLQDYFREQLGDQRLTHAGGAREDEATGRTLRILESRTRSADRFA